VGAGFYNGEVESVDNRCGFGCGAGGDFFDFSDGVEFVAGADAFWRVADEEPFVHFQAGDLFKYWHTVLFGSTGVDGGFIDDDVALFEHFAHRFRLP